VFALWHSTAVCLGAFNLHDMWQPFCQMGGFICQVEIWGRPSECLHQDQASQSLRQQPFSVETIFYAHDMCSLPVC
jgi:hypothetical protein